MQLTAKLIQVLPIESGMGKNGEWKKQAIILETEGMYPKKICIHIWGDKINPDLLQVGRNLIVDFDIESREFNGRWYTDAKARKVEVAEDASAYRAGYEMPEQPFQAPAPPADLMPDNDDIPF
ncbi:MAG: DUF3127 domain-containing protein [Dysgonamonadaceae bacterium]|jgi:hypothetical protein|nr:DUF3127 domain-containing protein [Dysgonamonadaceae bacterium]